MAEPKVQLVAPLGNLTVPGMNVTGVVTATLGDVGVAGSIIQGNNIDIGAGIITATSFVGDQIGTYRAASLTGSPDLVVGVVTSSGFVAQITGDVTGNLTGNVVGTAGSILSGNNVRAGIATVAGMSGDGSNLTGIAATSYNTQTVPGSTYSINVTNDGSSNYTLSGTDRNGTVSGSDPTVTVEVGDTLNFVVDASGHPFYIRVSDGGANVSTPAATNQGAQSGTVSWTPNTAGTYYYQCGNHAGMLGTITVTATTTIDLSAGNMITFNQEANTTISFANTETAMDVTLIRIKDTTTTARTITWPDSVKWNGGTAPTLLSSGDADDNQQFEFLTRDGGLTWYGWEPFSYDGPYNTIFGIGLNNAGQLAQNDSIIGYSSPVQVGSSASWGTLTHASSNWATKTDGTLWAWGSGSGGNPGLNSQTQYSSPTQVGTDTDWSVVTSGNYSNMGVKTDGTLWTCGSNSYAGQLGQNNTTAYSSPVQIGTETTWGQGRNLTNAGYAHWHSIKTDGTLWSCGAGSYGRMGNNTGAPTVKYSSPVQVGTDTNWAYIEGSHTASAAIKTDGTLWVWGMNNYGGAGHMGQNNQVERSSPTQIPGTTWSKVFNNSAYAFGAIKTDGTLWSWGANEQGQLGQNSTTYYSSPVQIPGTNWNNGCGATSNAAMVTKTDGTLWVWGQDYYGKLGLNQQGPTIKYSSPTQIPGTNWNIDNIHSNTAGYNAWAMQS